MGEVAGRVERELRKLGRPERAEKERQYLKSELVHLGVPMPGIRRVAVQAARDLGRAELVETVEALWARGVHELRMAAVEMLASRRDLLAPEDLALIERLIRESKTWALVDPLAATVAGGLLEDHPRLTRTLDRWARDPDFWVRRSAMLALLRPLRRGEGDFDRFARYADAMLEEKEFFIRKAIGWVLRDTSRKRPVLVYDWLLPRAARASGVTVREAVKYLSEAQRERIARERG